MSNSNDLFIDECYVVDTLFVFIFEVRIVYFERSNLTANCTCDRFVTERAFINLILLVLYFDGAFN